MTSEQWITVGVTVGVGVAGLIIAGLSLRRGGGAAASGLQAKREFAGSGTAETVVLECLGPGVAYKIRVIGPSGEVLGTLDRLVPGTSQSISLTAGADVTVRYRDRSNWRTHTIKPEPPHEAQVFWAGGSI